MKQLKGTVAWLSGTVSELLVIIGPPWKSAHPDSGSLWGGGVYLMVAGKQGSRVAGKQGARVGSGTGCSQGPTHNSPFPLVRPHLLRFKVCMSSHDIGAFWGKHQHQNIRVGNTMAISKSSWNQTREERGWIMGPRGLYTLGVFMLNFR